MNVLITGGAGFLGRRLARALLERGTLIGTGNRPERIDRLALLDVVPADGFSDPRVQVVAGDLGDDEVLRRALGAEPASVFHLAAVVSAQAEADFDLGMRVNVDATRRLLEACRRLARPPRFVSTSSVAVFGGALPTRIDEGTALHPQSSYGTQKAIGELLVSDYTRKGFVDGRVLRLPTVSVRPGRPNKAASSFASSIIREPLAGVEAICPVAPATRVWLASPRTVVANLILGHELTSDALGALRSVNVPGVSVSVAEMVAALEQVGGREVAARVRWEYDPDIDRLVSSWPGALDCSRAVSLGFTVDADFAAIIRGYIDENPASARNT